MRPSQAQAGGKTNVATLVASAVTGPTRAVR
jgi:hypothetical protein